MIRWNGCNPWTPVPLNGIRRLTFFSNSKLILFNLCQSARNIKLWAIFRSLFKFDFKSWKLLFFFKTKLKFRKAFKYNWILSSLAWIWLNRCVLNSQTHYFCGLKHNFIKKRLFKNIRYSLMNAHKTYNGGSWHVLKIFRNYEL